MIYTYSIQIIRFVLLVLLQVLILNHLNLGGSLNPCIYGYFILLLPYATPRWLLLVLAFVLGFSIDIFTHTPGLNAAATILMAFFRPSVIRLISNGPEEELGREPSLRENGFTWFLSYTAILILIQITTLFFLELFRLSDFFITLWNSILSTLFSVALILLSEWIFFRSGRKAL